MSRFRDDRGEGGEPMPIESVRILGGGDISPVDRSPSSDAGDIANGGGGSEFRALSNTGTISRMKFLTSSNETAWPRSPSTRSTLFPTTATQKPSTSSSSSGARSLNSAHHFPKSVSVRDWFTSNMSKTASAPRKNALESDENRSWPAVSQICSVTASPSGLVGCGRDFVIKSAPIVAR